MTDEKIKDARHSYDSSNSKLSIILGFQSIEYLTEDLLKLLVD